MLLAFLSGCGDDPVTALGSCQVELDRIGISVDNTPRQTDFLQNCMESKGFDYRSEEMPCNGVRWTRFGFRGSCYEQRGPMRSLKLTWLKVTAKQ